MTILPQSSNYLGQQVVFCFYWPLICKYVSKTGEELKQHKSSSHTASESPNSKKIRMDLRKHGMHTTELNVKKIEIEVTLNTEEVAVESC